jgi:hypothetical protein
MGCMALPYLAPFHPVHLAVTRPVLHRLAGRDEVPADLRLLGPGQHGVGGELRAVIADDERRPAPPSHKGGELPRDPLARDRGVGHPCQALLRDIVENVEDAQTPPAGELVVDEVNGPACIRPGLDQDRGSRADRPLAAAPPAHAQALLAIEALGLLVVQPLALAPQQDVKASIAEAPALGREFPQPETQTGVIRPTTSVANRRAVGSDDKARPPLAHLVLAHDMGDGSRLAAGVTTFLRADPSGRRCRAWHRPEALELGVLVLKPLSRLASDTSKPPNLAFQA